MGRLARSVAAWFAAETHPANLAVVRITVFGILLERLASGGFRHFARLPEDLRILPPGIEPVLRVLPLDEGTLGAAQVAGGVFALLALVGLRSRTSAALATVLGTWVLGVPYLFGKVDHTLNHVIWFGALLAASPCGDALSLDTWLARRRGRPAPGPARAYALPIRLMWLLLGVAYFFPGLFKLLAGPSWILDGSLELLLHEMWHHRGMRPLLPADLPPVVFQIAALGTILFELSFVFLVLSRRTRPIAAAVGLVFHAAMAHFLRIFFVELMLCYVVFVDWHALAERLLPGPATPAGAAKTPSWRASAVVGAALLAANVACGAFRIDSWPFSVYPRFDRIRTDPTTTEVEALLEGGGESERLRLHVRRLRFTRVAQVPEGEARRRYFRALAEYALVRRGAIEPGQTVRFYAVTYSTLPEHRNAPPLRRELLFDYRPARSGEPRPAS